MPTPVQATRQLVAAGIVALGLATVSHATMPREQVRSAPSSEAICWKDPDTGRSFGQCWKGTIHEDASGILRSSTIRCVMPAEDGPPTADCRWRNPR